MKKLLILILAFALLVCLCACGSVSSDPTNAPTGGNSTEPTNGNMQTPTDAPCTHAYEETVTKQPTCQATGEKTFTCTRCGDHYTEEMPLADHTWIDAICVAPKTCSVCNATEGDVADHNYQDGVCTGCGLEQDFGQITGKWFLEGISNEYNEYEQMNLFFWAEDKTAGFSAAFFYPLEYTTQEELDFILTYGYYEYNGIPRYFYDVTEFNGQYYYSAMFGTTAAGSFKQNGNVITIELSAYYGGEGVLTLRRVSETVLEVVSIDDVVCDEVVSDIILNAGYFTLTQDEY